MIKSLHIALYLSAILLFMESGLRSLHAQSDKGIRVRTINGLTQRRLFDVATEYAESLLASDELSGRERVDISVALLDTMAQQAYQSPNPEAWQEARKRATQLELASQSPRKILIAVQATLLDQLQVERWIREMDVGISAEGTAELANTAIAKLVTRFADLQSEIKTLLNRRPSPREEAEWFSANELLTLRYNLEYQQARTLQYRAALYPKEDELNRKDVLTLVENQLNSVLQSTGPNLPLWWSVQADRIAIARGLGNFAAANRLYSSLPLKLAPTPSRDAVNAEWIRTLTQRKRFDDAISIAGKESFASKSPELDLARVELFVEKSSGDSGKTWQQRALELTESIEQNHGGYWGRLANLAVVGTAVRDSNNGTNLDLLIRVADEAQRKKQWDEALQALDAAFAQAVKTNQSEIAWKLGFRAASIEQSQGKFPEAKKRFESLANQYAKLKDAHTGYLMACWNLTRTMKNRPEELEQYETMLVRLIETWPNSSSADQARIWLAAVRNSQSNRPAAISLLLQVNAASPLFGKSITDLSRTVVPYLRQSDLSKETKSKIESAIASRLQPLLEVPAESLPDNWNQTRSQIVLLLAKLETLFGAELGANLDSQLKNLVSNTSLSNDVREDANALQFVRAPFELPMAPTPSGRSRQLEIIREGLTRVSGDSEAIANAERLISASRKLSDYILELSPSQQKKWQEATLDALILTGKTSEALELATAIAKANPRTASAQIGLAKLLTQQASGSEEYREAALNQWRKVARASRKQTAGWFTAKYYVAKLLNDQGKREDALKLLNFIRAVPPGWDKAPNATDFNLLFQQLSDL